MHSLRSARTRRAAALVAVAAAALSGCSETEGTPVSARPSSAAASGSPAAPTPTGPEAVSLQAGWDKAGFGPGVGLALAPVGGGAVLTFGDQTERVAWSTIKVPLSLAALRNADDPKKLAPTVRSAIENSDNDAALKLRESLGGVDEARTKMDAVFRSGGDENTEAVAIKSPDETFGLTPWKLADAATFAAHLPCMKDSGTILTSMGRVAENQQWGLESLSSPKFTTAVKGGWGPADQGGYEVRQLGLITFGKNGPQLAVTMASYRAGEEMGTGVSNLNKVAAWLQKNLATLPRGECRSS